MPVDSMPSQSINSGYVALIPGNPTITCSCESVNPNSLAATGPVTVSTISLAITHLPSVIPVPYPTPMTPTDDNTNTTPVILTAIADDRPNLLETILTTIGGAGGATIETVAQTSLETAVSITLLIRVPKGGTTPSAPPSLA